MYAEQQLVPADLHEGTPVEVATHFTGSWSRGFEVAALHRDGCQVRRLSDGAVLPIDFDYSSVRVASRHPVGELIARFERATRPYEVAAIAEQLGEAGEHCAVLPLLTRLGDREVQNQPDLAEVLCGALVALDVMCRRGGCAFAVRPRHLLEPDVVEAITEMGTTFPMRYLIARQV